MRGGRGLQLVGACFYVLGGRGSVVRGYRRPRKVVRSTTSSLSQKVLLREDYEGNYRLTLLLSGVKRGAGGFRGSGGGSPGLRGRLR